MADDQVKGTPSPSPPPCAKGCGFFGSASTMNMCSKCFREHQRSNPQPVDPEPVVPKAVAPVVAATSIPVAAIAAPVVTAPPQPRKVQKNTSRCFSCRKKIGLTGFKCHCDYVFCAEHRYSDKHECDYDYQKSAREQLEKANPVVVASKLEKI